MKRQYVCSKNLDAKTEKTVQNEMKLGYMNLSEGYFDQAKQNFKLALAFDENAPDAYWGLMLCRLEAKTEDELQNSPNRHKASILMEECKKALALADSDLKKIYDSLLEDVKKVCLGDEY